MNGGRVVVVGSGLAGLAAAWRLQSKGFEVTVLERADSAGGRLTTYREGGYAFDIGPPGLSMADDQLLEWIAEVGLGSELLPLRPMLTSMVQRGRTFEVDARSRWGVARIRGVRRLHALRLMRMSRLIARYSQQLDWDAPEFAPALDDRSLEDFGRLYFGNSVLDRWMAPMVTRCSLGDARETSRVLFLRTLLHEGRERHGALRAAFDELPQFVAGRLSVRYGAEVNRLAQRKRPGVRVIFREDSDTGAQKELSRQADAVVVATSPAEALRIASPLLSIGERDALSEVRFTSSIVLCCALRRPLYSQSKLVQLSRDEGSPLETVLFEPAARDGRAPEGHGIATLRATGAWSESRQGVSNEQVTQEMLSALQSFDPAAARAVDWSRLVRIDDAVPHFGVGHYRLIARLERIFDDQQARGRRVFLAGDYLMGPSREAAVASGERTARRIMAC